MAPQSMKENT